MSEPSATAQPADDQPLSIAAATTARPQDLSIIIPAYNEASRLERTLTTIRDYARQGSYRWEVIVVDDGSTDGTADLARAFPGGPLSIRLARHEQNRGKGFSVRHGMKLATKAHRLMTDADLSTPIDQLERLFPAIREGYDVVIGSRHLPEAILAPPQPPLRRIMDAVFRRLRRRIMLPEIVDTQCGFKLFTARAAQHIFYKAREEKFAFDCEVLLLARQVGLRIKEVPICWGDDRDSRVRPLRDALQMTWALLRIRRRLHRSFPEPPSLKPKR
jgi:dolichyl-phosphate beta-glucosyltransferase